MNASELLLAAQNIADNYVKSGSDLNSGIVKIASEGSLNKSQIERLVEESNKATFLTLLEKKGEQDFPVASYDEVRKLMVPHIEKKASENLHFGKLTYSNSLFNEQIKNDFPKPTIEKVAETKQLTEDEVAHVEAIMKVAEELWSGYNHLLDLESIGRHRYGQRYSDNADLVKVAETHNDSEIVAIKDLEASLTKKAQVLEYLYNKMEKTASFVWGETNMARAALNAGGSVLNRGAKAAGALVNLGMKGTIKGIGVIPVGAAKLGLKGAAKAAPVLVPFAAQQAMKHPNIAITTALEGPRSIGIAKNVMKQKNLIGPASEMLKSGSVQLFKTPLKTMTKQADFKSGLQHALEFVTPAVVYGSSGPFGVLAGITAAAAKKLGGGIALTMNKKEFDNSFDTIMKNNPELAEDKKQIRSYFDVISRHAPSLAKDPLVAESIVKNMNAFGGVDYSTVRGLRETEALSSDRGSEKGLSGLHPFFGTN